MGASTETSHRSSQRFRTNVNGKILREHVCEDVRVHVCENVCEIVCENVKMYVSSR